MSDREQSQARQGDLSDYEKFRMIRLRDNNDYENMSAHFSNQFSTRTDPEKDWDLPMGRHNNGRNREKELEDVLVAKEKQINQLRAKWQSTHEKWAQSEKKAQFWRRKFQEKSTKDQETKKKLQKWVKQAKNDLEIER